MFLEKLLLEEFSEVTEELPPEELGLINIFISGIAEEPLQELVDKLIELIPEEKKKEGRALIGGIMASSQATAASVLFKLKIASREAMAEKLIEICAKDPRISSYLHLIDALVKASKEEKNEEGKLS